jgi:hypothetical protein
MFKTQLTPKRSYADCVKNEENLTPKPTPTFDDQSYPPLPVKSKSQSVTTNTNGIDFMLSLIPKGLFDSESDNIEFSDEILDGELSEEEF